jgi:steroid delta-isomerase-like uncharacterized protein
MPRSHKALVLAASTELFSDGNLDAIPNFFAADYVAHVTDGTMNGGHTAIRQVLAAIKRSFPDLRCDVEILVENKDRVAWQRTLTGVQKAAFKGFPSKGRKLVWRDMVTSRISDGLIAEEWVVTDFAERLLLAQKSV